ncbi:MAG: hypothetical protein M3497_10060, partial [Gemmatimonadota bacterium]|nr:hypothetical protein [Gemmatimonadota bacterium]
MSPKPAHRIDLRDKRLPGGRLSLSARTPSRPEARKREAALRTLLEKGDAGLMVLARLRAREVHIADVARAVEAGDLSPLLRTKGLSLTLGAAVARLERDLGAQDRARGTRTAYLRNAGLMLDAWGPDALLADLRTSDVEEWLRARSWAPRTQAVAVAVGHRMWAAAMRTEEDRDVRTIRVNPWSPARLVLPKVRATRVGFLQPEQWRSLARATEGRPHAALVGLCCLAGLRKMEAGHLRMGTDVDMERRVLHIQPRGGEYAWRPKTDNSVRSVPIGEELHGILTRHIEAGYAGDRYLIRA